MEKITEVYRVLHDKGVYMFDRRIPCADAAVLECDGVYGLFVDSSQFHTSADERVAVAHDAGHIMTGATHKVCSPCDLVAKHEAKADKWAIKKLIPQDELDQAVADGYTELWQLAEHFDVTEDFITKAVCLYTFGNLAVNEYFPA